jgi:hypothetical protein
MSDKRKARPRKPFTFEEIERFDGQINSALLQRFVDTALLYDERRQWVDYSVEDRRLVFGWSGGTRLFANYNLSRAVAFLKARGQFLRFWGITIGEYAIGVVRRERSDYA